MKLTLIEHDITPPPGSHIQLRREGRGSRGGRGLGQGLENSDDGGRNQVGDDGGRSQDQEEPGGD